jgi:Ca2+-binding EF-hand superfamily protein
MNKHLRASPLKASLIRILTQCKWHKWPSPDHVLNNQFEEIPINPPSVTQMGAKKKGGKAKKAKQEEEEALRKQKAPLVRERFDKIYAVYSIAEKDDPHEIISEDDIPHFIRSLGIYPTNTRLREIIESVKDEEAPTCFFGPKLEEVLTPLIIEAMLNPTSELAAPSEEALQVALKSLDLEHKGHLTEGDFRTLLSNNAEKLDPDELEPAVDEAVNPATGVVDLDRYAGRLLYNAKIF